MKHDECEDYQGLASMKEHTFFQICGNREVRYRVVQIQADIRPMVCSMVGPGSGGWPDVSLVE